MATTDDLNPDANRDPITGAPGAHPVGTGVGATGGALAGAAIGAIGGPIGAAVGLVAGAVVGGLGGKGVAEAVNPTVEDAYWQDRYAGEAYYETGRSYADYRPAYEMGWTGRSARDAEFEDVEPELASQWESRRGSSPLTWEQARPATRAAWNRTDRVYYADAVSSNTMSRDDVVDTLNDLLETSRDGEYGFSTAADAVRDPQLKQVFSSRAADCRRAVEELIPLIANYGGKPAEGGTVAGALHRGWVNLKDAVGADSDLSMLESTESGEDTAVARYRKALKQNLPADVRGVVERQAQGAQRNHDQIRDLRNAARARARAL